MRDWYAKQVKIWLPGHADDALRRLERNAVHKSLLSHARFNFEQGPFNPPISRDIVALAFFLPTCTIVRHPFESAPNGRNISALHRSA